MLAPSTDAVLFTLYSPKKTAGYGLSRATGKKCLLWTLSQPLEIQDPELRDNSSSLPPSQLALVSGGRGSCSQWEQHEWNLRHEKGTQVKREGVQVDSRIPTLLGPRLLTPTWLKFYKGLTFKRGANLWIWP